MLISFSENFRKMLGRILQYYIPVFDTYSNVYVTLNANDTFSKVRSYNLISVSAKNMALY